MAKDNNEATLYAISNALVSEDDFQLSSLAPNLYEIDDDVTKLVELYKENQEILSKTEYSAINDDIQEFFVNYNTYENHEQEAITLIDSYNQVEIQIAEKQKEQKKIALTVGAITTVVLLGIIFIKIKLNGKKKRKNKKRTASMKNRQINRTR